ncbi:MAG: ABC transporter permease [Acidipropionibacterium sp.]|nr:ABC transporter permease [Acidipropionibacterium sp.]
MPPADSPASASAGPTAPVELASQPAPPAPIEVPGAGTLRATRTILPMLARPTLADRRSWALPVTAFAVISTIILDVAAGAVMFWRIPGEIGIIYRSLSGMAVVLLVLPLMTLASSAARLSARRRDDRLSSLRLLGATSGTLRLLTLAEAGGYALIGSLIGLAGYAASVPLLGMLHFDGRRIGAGSLILEPGALAAVIAALVVLALVSSAVSLRRVEISPLGVRMRSSAQGVSMFRIVAGAALLAAAALSSVIARGLGSSAGPLVAIVIVLFAVGAGLTVINIVGPKLLALHFRARLRKARTAPAVVAARMVLEAPKAAWRQVSALGAVCFVGVAGGAGVAMLDKDSPSAQASAQADPSGAFLVSDIRTGIILTIAFAFATVACSVGINQTAAVLDRRDVEVGLDLIGMTMAEQEEARRRAVLGPLWFVMVVSIASSAIVLSPLVGAALVLSPITLLVTLGVIALGAAMVVAGLRATRSTMAGVLREGLTRVE